MAGTARASTTPTRQIRQAATWTPAVNVPSANSVSSMSALASEFILLFYIRHEYDRHRNENRNPVKGLGLDKVPMQRIALDVSPAGDHTDNAV